MIDIALKSRWKPEFDTSPKLQPLKKAFEVTLDAFNDIRKAQDRIQSDPNLTQVGRQDAMRKALTDDHVGRLRRAQTSVKAIEAQITQWRQRLQPPAIDRSDVAGAALRSEMRGMLRSMSPGARLGTLLHGDADLQLLQAALEAPNVMTGITNEIREQLSETIAKRLYPKEIAAIEQAEQAAELVQVAYRVAHGAAMQAGEFPNEFVFDAFLDSAVGPKAEAIDAAAERDFLNLSVAA